MSAPRCTYRGCDRPPVKLLRQSIGQRVPWLGCRRHWPAMNDALHNGLPGATSGGAWVDVTPVPKSFSA